MKGNRILAYIAFAIVLLLGIYFIFIKTDSGKGGEDSGKDSNRALSALLGGADQGSQGGSGDQQSIFQSGYWKSGVPDKPAQDASDESSSDDDSGIIDPASKDNPVNPQTGQPFTDSMMKAFDDLRKKFPDNSVIPRKMTPEERAEQENQRQQMYVYQSLINQGKADKEQIDQYYDYQSKQIKDRLDLLDYIIKEQGNGMPSDFKEKYEQIVKMNQNQLDSYSKARENALKRAEAGGSTGQ